MQDDCVCRICYGSTGTLIVPCKCDGTMKYVHRDCLNSWRRHACDTSAFEKCGQCDTYYIMKKNCNTFVLESNVMCVILKFFVFILSVAVSSMVTNRYRLSSVTCQYLKLESFSITAYPMIECCCSGFIIIGIYGFVTSIIRTERKSKSFTRMDMEYYRDFSWRCACFSCNINAEYD